VTATRTPALKEPTTARCSNDSSRVGNAVAPPYYDESSNGSGNAGSEIDVFLSHDIVPIFNSHQDRDTINPRNVIYTRIGITLAVLDLRRCLLSQMSSDGADNREYRAIRRIQKACTNCR
jgi:hypothetical protein